MEREPTDDGLPGGSSASQHGAAGLVGWDVDAPQERVTPVRDDTTPLTAQVLSLLSDPRVEQIGVGMAVRALHRPAPEIDNAIAALVQAGDLLPAGEIAGQFTVTPERKYELEAMFIDSAEELGEVTALARRHNQALAAHEADDEPRLPVTAGLLSLFLPGTGQLLNGDVGRASLVFAVWSLALLTHLSPIWTFVALYAGAEAFFTAKIRGMEKKMQRNQRALPPRPARDEPAPGGA